MPIGAATARLIDAVLAGWPEHERFLAKSFSGRSAGLLQTTELIADFLLTLAADRATPISRFAEDYRYLCEEIVYPEELFFSREGRYRLSRFEDAAREVYHNAPLMDRYMRGLLVSDVLWVNHASAMHDFASRYLPSLEAGGRHLEIGPGHGMLLYLALRSDRFSTLSAWDLSATSIDHTRRVLARLDARERVKLELQDMFAPDALATHRAQFDSVVFSEVLEHLEAPRDALAIIQDLLAPGGTVWINVPANGPAPDHLYLFRSPDEVVDMVASTGLEVIRADAFPLAGYSVERALRQGLAISCVVVGRKAR